MVGHRNDKGSRPSKFRHKISEEDNSLRKKAIGQPKDEKGGSVPLHPAGGLLPSVAPDNRMQEDYKPELAREGENLDALTADKKPEVRAATSADVKPEMRAATSADVKPEEVAGTSTDEKPEMAAGTSADKKPEVAAGTSAERKCEEKWKTGEKILCFHGPLIYEAKIQTVEVQNGMHKYFIHYHGWNKNWDEWVPEARMLKFTEKNVVVQKDLVRAHEEKNNEKRGRSLKRKLEECGGEERVPEHVFAVPKPPSPVPRPRRKAGLRPQKREVKSYKKDEEDEDEEEGVVRKGVEGLKPPDNTVESEEIYRSKVEIRLKIPDELKSYIVDDWEQITRHKTLCVVPARLTVDQLLDNYTRAKTSNKSETACKNNKEKAILEVTAGLRDYFNVMLPAQLLYKQERQQLEQLKKTMPTLVPVKVYGAPHLLRLFTKLGEALVYTPLGEKTVSLLLLYVNDILNYIKRNSSLIFSNSDYNSPEPGEVEPGVSAES